MHCWDWFSYGNPGKRLVLSGPTGCGKTTLAMNAYTWARAASIMAWEKKHWSRAPRVASVPWQMLVDGLEEKRSMSSIVASWEEEDFLVLDDLGAETDRFKTGQPTELLCALLSICQGRNWIIVTTNVPPAQWKERWDARVEDRLLRDSEVIDLTEVESWSKL